MRIPSNHIIQQSYYRQRRALGILGLCLPLILILGSALPGANLEPSISDFFHTVLRDAFVGSLFAIGVFLLAYEGYDKGPDEIISDRALSTIAGIFALLVGFFPNETLGDVSGTFVREIMSVRAAAMVHYVSAMGFLFCLAIFCFYKFARSAQPGRRPIYMACGWIILAGTVFAIIASVLKQTGSPATKAFVLDWSLVFWGEAVAIWAFSLSWLIKGHVERMFHGVDDGAD